MVVLVDGRSASAAELMAAALADSGRAVVAGSTTLGKGLVQAIHVLPDDGELFVSWSRILAPSGWPLQGQGVLPQLCTSFGPEHTNEQLASLEHGTQPMAAVLARHRATRPPVSAGRDRITPQRLPRRRGHGRGPGRRTMAPGAPKGLRRGPPAVRSSLSPKDPDCRRVQPVTACSRRSGT